MLLADIRYALRWLRRSPGFTSIAVLSLAIGIGFNTALFTIVDAVLFRPLPVERPDRLVDIYTSSRDGDAYATSSYPDYLDLKAKNEVFSDVLGFSPSLAAVKLADGAKFVLGEVVTGNYFQLLGIKPLIGRTLLPEDDRPGAPRVTMLSYRLWMREYGSSASVVGQTMRIRNQAYTIVGVAPRGFTGIFPVISTELWTTMAHLDEIEPGGIIDNVGAEESKPKLERRGYRWLFLKGRLKADRTVEAAGANLAVVMKQLGSAYPETDKDRRLSVKRTSDVHIHPDADKYLRPIAAGLMLAVGLVLLIACANVASMLLARASGRQREIGIRLAIGASRARLVRQLLTESVVMSVFGAGAGVLLAWLLTKGAASVQLPLPVPLTVDMAIDGRVLAFTTLVTVVAAVVAGLMPALKATRPNLTSELKGDAAMTRTAGVRWSMRDALVAVQIAMTLVLLVASGLLTRSLNAAQHIKLGFNPEGIAIVSAETNVSGYDGARSTEFFARALDRIKALPDVAAAGLTVRSAFSVNYNQSKVFMPGVGPDDKGITVDSTRVSDGYFDAMGVSIVQGRNFNGGDTPLSPGVVIVNETMARKYWPNASAIGQHLRRNAYDGPLFEVVGIAADHKVNTVGEKPTPYMHFAYSQAPETGETIVARTHGDASALVESIRRELTTLEPTIVILDHQTMTTQVGATLLPALFGAIGVSAVGLVAMLLAAVGLYGVIAYSVSRRTREIGIRMALGAKPGEVLGLVMRQGMMVAAAGAAGGMLLAFGVAKLVAGALYDVSPIDPAAWLGALALLATVSVLANLIPATRAARVDPSVALRSE